MGQRQPAIMHKLNSLQIFSNSLQSVFRKKQTELFIIHSDKEMLSVLADIWKYINSKKTPIYSIWRMGVCKKPTTLLGIPLLVFLAWFWALALCYLEDLKKKKGTKPEHKSTCIQEKCISCCFSKTNVNVELSSQPKHFWKFSKNLISPKSFNILLDDLRENKLRACQICSQCKKWWNVK